MAAASNTPAAVLTTGEYDGLGASPQPDCKWPAHSGHWIGSGTECERSCAASAACAATNDRTSNRSLTGLRIIVRA